MAVVFDCSSNMAMFRKPYTTTSSVSFSFPPPTAIAGIIGAIVGIDHCADKKAYSAAYWDELAGTSVAVGIRNRLRWLSASLNLWNMKNPGKAPHIQVKHQFVAYPEYRIYVRGRIEEELRKRLEKEEFVYTPFMGAAYALASIKYVGSCEEVAVTEDVLNLDSVLPLSEGIELNIASCGRVFKEIVPFQLTDCRSLAKAITVLYTDDTKMLSLKKWGAADVTRCLEDTVAWFPRW